MAKERLPTENSASTRHMKGTEGQKHLGAEKIPLPGKSCTPVGHRRC